MLLDADLITILIPRWRLKVSKNVAAEPRLTEGLSRLLVSFHSAGLRTGDSDVKTRLPEIDPRGGPWQGQFHYAFISRVYTITMGAAIHSWDRGRTVGTPQKADHGVGTFSRYSVQ
jgi:hypothetical protein